MSAACIGGRIIPRCTRLLRPRHLDRMHTIGDDTAQWLCGLGQLAVVFLAGRVTITAAATTTAVVLEADEFALSASVSCTCSLTAR